VSDFDEAISKLVDGMPDSRDRVMLIRLLLRARDMVEADWGDGTGWKALANLRAQWTQLLEHIGGGDVSESTLEQRLVEARFALVDGNEDREDVSWVMLDDWLFYIQTGKHRDGDTSSIFEEL